MPPDSPKDVLIGCFVLLVCLAVLAGVIWGGYRGVRKYLAWRRSPDVMLKRLTKQLGDEDQQQRRIAVSKLGQLKDERAVEPLCRALEDDDIHVRCGAAKALGWLKSPRALRPLMRSASERHRLVRAEAARALCELEWEEPQRGGAHLPALLAALEGEPSHWVAKVLGNYGDTRAVEPLIAALGKDPPSYVEKAMIAALGRLGDSRAVPFLISLLERPSAWGSTKPAAAEALGNIGDPRAIEHLKPHVGSLSFGLGKAARAAIKKIESAAQEPKPPAP